MVREIQPLLRDATAVTNAPFAVLYEDNHLLVVDKPPLLVTMGAPAGTPSLIEQARDYIRRRYNKPGNVYLGIVSRLDAPVSGALVIARTSKAASRLTEQFRQGAVLKKYWALVEEAPQPASGHWTDWLMHHDRHRKVLAVEAGQAGAKRAELSYRLLDPVGGYQCLEVELQTGRKHQIRVQLSARGLPIVGDRKYDSQRPFPTGIALHSRQLGFAHPVGGEWLEFLVDPPGSWPRRR
jgi:23S rRNA pseudouridine1911/1915/1917 synthase